MDQLLSNAPLFYPSAREWMWSYCIYLGPFTNSEGRNFDLGVCITDTPEGISGAIVYGDTPGNYYSGRLESFSEGNGVHSEIYVETKKRAVAIGLIKSE